MTAPRVDRGRELLAAAARALADLGDGHLGLEPAAGLKTAGWLVGHLAVTGDYARRLCARPPLCPVAWRPLFGPGSQPAHDQSAYPPMAELCDALRRVYADLADAAMAAEPERLAGVNPFEPARAAYPTARDFVDYLMVDHVAHHLAQLNAWRTAAGLPVSP